MVCAKPSQVSTSKLPGTPAETETNYERLDFLEINTLNGSLNNNNNNIKNNVY